jgi:hypothetical protein
MNEQVSKKRTEKKRIKKVRQTSAPRLTIKNPPSVEVRVKKNVPTKGIEPSHPCEWQILSLLRLPIPPHGHVTYHFLRTHPSGSSIFTLGIKAFLWGCNITESLLSYEIFYMLSFFLNLILQALKRLKCLR